MNLLDRIIGLPELPPISMEDVGHRIFEFEDDEVEEVKTVSPEPLEVPLGQATSDFLKFGYTNAHSPSSAMGLYDQSSFVSIPVNKVSKPFSTISPVLYNMRTKKTTSDHAVLDLLRKPCPAFTQELFFKTLANHFLITGDCAYVAAGNITRPPLSVSPISPADISAIEGDDGLASSYHIGGMYYPGTYSSLYKENEQHFYDDQFAELRLIRDYATDRGSRIRGQSLLKSASRDVRQAVLGTEHNVSLLEKGGRFSMIFNFETDMDADDYKVMKQRIMSQYGGASKAGTIGVTNGEKLRIVPMGANNVEMDYANLTEMIKQTLALLYDVPLPLVSLSASTMNNYEIANLALWDDAILPLAKVILGGLGEVLLPRFGLDLGEWRLIVDREQITALMMRTLEELKIRVANGLETRDEMRSVLGREATVGGNQFYIESTKIPDGTDIADDGGELFDEDGLRTPIADPEADREEEERTQLEATAATQIGAIVALVADGDMDRDGAAKLITLTFNISMEDALVILGPDIEPESPKEPVIPLVDEEEDEEEGEEEEEEDD